MSATRIRSVGGTTIGPIHRATCHCGAVELELRLPHGIVDPQRCDCSLCRRRGAIAATVPLPDLRVVRGHAALRLYQFHTRTAKHYFCSVCGVYTHHQRRSDPNEYGVNVGCLEGVDPLLLDPVLVSDGVHHPSDSQPE
ncbi:GFA family protein [Lysobacter enzymogenes]|uniref:GFA family protein n=1 Tax=Lysobacter enzymogenes TaxID=69 RepID=UPI001AF0A8EA|nr:GFA family protein [Lysobacter enzymogenes]QQQ00809.1 GFA family protein [Lysobacter enzymogenes]